MSRPWIQAYQMDGNVGVGLTKPHKPLKPKHSTYDGMRKVKLTDCPFSPENWTTLRAEVFQIGLQPLKAKRHNWTAMADQEGTIRVCVLAQVTALVPIPPLPGNDLRAPRPRCRSMSALPALVSQRPDLSFYSFSA